MLVLVPLKFCPKPARNQPGDRQTQFLWRLVRIRKPFVARLSPMALVPVAETEPQDGISPEMAAAHSAAPAPFRWWGRLFT
jgi:hypothetical protein